VSGYLERLGKPLPEDGKNFGEAKKLYFSAATELFWRYNVNIITVYKSSVRRRTTTLKPQRPRGF
jgi:hypothetical protein